jgi:hypothetical protein
MARVDLCADLVLPLLLGVVVAAYVPKHKHVNHFFLLSL